MSVDRTITSGVLGGPPRPPQGDANKRDLLVFGHDAERCRTTGRFFEIRFRRTAAQRTDPDVSSRASDRTRPVEGRQILPANRAPVSMRGGRTIEDPADGKFSFRAFAGCEGAEAGKRQCAGCC